MDTATPPPGQRPLPVLHLIDSLDCGGAQQLLVELAAATDRRAHPTSVAVIQPLHGLAERLEALGVTVHRLGRERASITRPLDFAAYVLGTVWDVVRLCRRLKVAVLHCHLSDAEFLGTLAGRLAGVPSVVNTVHTPLLMPERTGRDSRNWLRARLIPLVLNRADRVIAVSPETGQALARLGVHEDKLSVVENGVAEDDPDAAPDPALRAELGLSPGGPVLVAVARLTEQKGLAHLVRAMPAVLESHPDASLLILGEGDMRPDLEREISRLGLSGRVSLPGVRPDVRAALRLADVFVMPSLWEGTSLALLEAMAASRPIVATNIAGNRALLSDGSNALLVPPGDSGSLARAMSLLLSDPALAGRLGDRARQDMAATHSIRAMAQTYRKLWLASPRLAAGKAIRVAVTGLRGIPATWGGVEHQCEQLYSRLASMGFDVTVYARKGYTDPAVTSHKGVRVVCLPTVNTKHLEALAHTALAVLHAGLRRSDLWHIYSQGPFLCSPLARLMRPGRPLFFTCGGLDWQRRKWSGFASFAIALGEKLSARLASRVIVVSRTLGAYYRERYGVDSLCIPNGVDIPGPVPMEAVRIEGLAPRGYFLFVGRLVPEKRIEDLIKAMSLLPGDVRLVVAGGSAAADDYESGLRALAAADPRVVLAGNRYGEELAGLYSNALAYVTASELEGLPLTLLEAMSHGLPCLASDIGPHREVLEPLGQGLVPVHDPAALAEAMAALAAMGQAGRDTLGEAGREHVRGHYSWDRAATALARAYRESLGFPP